MLMQIGPLNLHNADLKLTAGAPAQLLKSGRPQIAFSGRSNVGKSSLVNCLLGRKKLARVSGEPGKTITVNYYDIDGRLFFVDLPGYGYAKTGKERRKIWKKFIDEYLLTSPRLQFVCQLIDIRHEPMASDVEMFQWLVEHHVPVLIIATKADKIGKNARQKNVAAIRRALGVKEISILPYSSVKNEGRSDLLDVIREILV